MVEFGQIGGLQRVLKLRFSAASSRADILGGLQEQGDAFDAGFIDGVLNGESTQDCLRRACICGALCTTQVGALDGLPDSFSLRSTDEQTYGP